MRQSRYALCAAIRQVLAGDRAGRSSTACGGLSLDRSAAGYVESMAGAFELAAQAGRVDVATVMAGRSAPPGTGSGARLAKAAESLLKALSLAEERRRQAVREQMHALRTPLTLARANVHVLRQTPALEPAVQAALLQELDHDIRRISGLLEVLAASLVEPEAPRPHDTEGRA